MFFKNHAVFFTRFYGLARLLTLAHLAPMVVSCRVVPNGAGGGSFLKNVYDSRYVLRLTQGSEPSVYRFETCMHSGEGQVIDSSCVNALRDETGREIYYELDLIDHLQLDEQQSAHVERVKTAWHQFRQAEASRPVVSQSDFLVLGGTLGGGVLAMSAGMATESLQRINATIILEDAYAGLKKITGAEN